MKFLNIKYKAIFAAILVSSSGLMHTTFASNHTKGCANTPAGLQLEVIAEGGELVPHNKKASWIAGQTFTQSNLDIGGISVTDSHSGFGLSMLFGSSTDPFTVRAISGPAPTISLESSFYSFMITKKFKLARVFNNHVLLSSTIGLGRQGQYVTYVSIPGGMEQESDYTVRGYAGLIDLKAQYWYTNHNFVVHSHQVTPGDENGGSIFLKASYLAFANDYKVTDPDYLTRPIQFNQSGYSIDIGTTRYFDL